MVHEGFNVRTHNIAVDDTDVVVMFQSLIEDRQQMVIQFDSGYGCPCFGQCLGQRSNARPDFKDRIAFTDICSIGDVIDDTVANEEVLPQLLIHAQAKAVDDVADDVGIR